MNPLICEMCGNNDVVKQDGLYVCQFCGTKYSVEEAKKIMLSGSVRIDNIGSADNYLLMAENAFKSKNMIEAENYCNKTIEINHENYQAWMLKGKVSGWQSSLTGLRIDELENCFINAFELAPEEEKENVKQEISSEMQKIIRFIIGAGCNAYAQNISGNIASLLLGTITRIQRSRFNIQKTIGSQIIDPRAEIVNMLDNVAMHAWNSVKAGYPIHPNRIVWEKFIDRADSIISITEAANSYSVGVLPPLIDRYNRLKEIQSSIIESCSEVFLDGVWKAEYAISPEERRNRREMVRNWEQKIVDIQRGVLQ